MASAILLSMMLAIPAGARQPAGFAAGELAPGTLVEAKPAAGAPAAAAAYQITYRSTGLDGQPISVTGLIVIPRDPALATGRAIVAWAHPTTGIVAGCAPSTARKRFEMIAGLQSLVERGYIVVATDYPGLGSEGPHPYLVGDSEGRAVLDAVRAARALVPDAGPRFVVWGHSQGGHAALFTGQMARSYAPELQLLGVAAAAPATDLAALLEADLGTPGGNNLTAMTLWSWSRVYHAPMSEVIDPSALPVVDRLAAECIESIFDVIERGRTTKPLLTKFLNDPSFATKEPWASLLRRNTPGAPPRNVPVLIAQGEADNLVMPRITREYARRLCIAGGSVRLIMLPEVGHAWIAAKSSAAVVDWIDDRFSGARAPSDCAVLTGSN